MYPLSRTRQGTNRLQDMRDIEGPQPAEGKGLRQIPVTHTYDTIGQVFTLDVSTGRTPQKKSFGKLPYIRRVTDVMIVRVSD
jgi:hypothetical protein